MDISIQHDGGEAYIVRVLDAGALRTEHRVRVSDRMAERFGAGAPVEELLRESFAFLLEREPPESILARFDLDVIERYFPEYASKIAERLRGAG